MTDEVAYLTPSEIPPLKDGETRMTFASKAALLEYSRSGEWYRILGANRTALSMDFDGTLVLDIIPIIDASRS